MFPLAGSQGFSLATSMSSSFKVASTQGVLNPFGGSDSTTLSTRGNSLSSGLEGDASSVATPRRNSANKASASRQSLGMSVLSGQDAAKYVKEPTARRSNSTDEGYTINKLQFRMSVADRRSVGLSQASEALVGRAKEIKILQQALVATYPEKVSVESDDDDFEQALPPQLDDDEDSGERKRKQLIMLAGSSGTGKSALAQCLREHVMFPCTYAQGKFDLQQQNNQPYAAIASAVGELCASLLRDLSAEKMMDFQEKLRASLGVDLRVLLRVFRVLQEIVDDQDLVEELSNAEDSSNAAAAKHRFSFAFCRFIRIVSGFVEGSLVFVLDDLQWADSPSLDVMEALLLDRETSTAQYQGAMSFGNSSSDFIPAAETSAFGLLVIGIYRSNEVDQAHILSSRIREWRLRSAGESRTFQMREMTVENLSQEAVNSYVTTVVSSTDWESHRLAELCYRRTQGNIFFLIHFLRSLQRQNLLVYSFGQMKWIWDLDEVEEKTVVSENVVDLLLQKMEDLSTIETVLLRMASCLGATFEGITLDLLWNRYKESKGASTSTPGWSDDDLDYAVDMLVDYGYLHHGRRGTFQFTHDKVQEASSLLQIPDDDRNSDRFQTWVGEALLAGFEESELESALFVVVNLLNNGTTSSISKAEFADLNLRAATKAVSFSAFEAASSYAASGLSLLGDNALRDHYDAALELLTIGAKAESALGNMEMTQRYCQTVINWKGPERDKLRINSIWIVALGNAGKLREAADETIRVLALFGVKFPKGKILQTVGLLSNIQKIKKSLKNKFLKTIDSLPLEEDPLRIELLHILDRLCVYLYLIQDDMMPHPIFQNFNWTAKYGINDLTPTALGTMAIIFNGILNDLRGGSQLASAALSLIPRVSPTQESRILFVTNVFGVVWTHPIRKSLKSLLRSYELGLCSGDIESAFWSISVFLTIRFMTGFPIDLCIEDMEMYVPQMKEFNHMVAYHTGRLMQEGFMNLAGRTNTEPLSITGEILSAEDHEVWQKEDPFYFHYTRLWECYFRTIYGRHEECAKLAIEYGLDGAHKANPGCISIALMEVFCKGVSSAIAARRHGRVGRVDCRTDEGVLTSGESHLRPLNYPGFWGNRVYCILVADVDGKLAST